MNRGPALDGLNINCTLCFILFLDCQHNHFSWVYTRQNYLQELVSWIWWLSVVSTLFYVVFFAVGPGSIPWMITAELFSQGPRPAAMSVAVLINWCANFLVAIGFPTMQVTTENKFWLSLLIFCALSSNFKYLLYTF